MKFFGAFRGAFGFCDGLFRKIYPKLTHIFTRLDEYFYQKGKREEILFFCLPILLCLFVVFACILPTIDERYEQAIFGLNQQEQISKEFMALEYSGESTGDETNPRFKNPLQLQLKNAQKILHALREKSITNDGIEYVLKPFNPQFDTTTKSNITNQSSATEFANTPQDLQNLTPPTNLLFSVVGDSEVLEDILEILEKNPFIFIQNMSINAPFASGLEMRFEAINFGEIFHSILEQDFAKDTLKDFTKDFARKENEIL